MQWSSTIKWQLISQREGVLSYLLVAGCRKNINNVFFNYKQSKQSGKLYVRQNVFVFREQLKKRGKRPRFSSAIVK